MQNGEQTNHIEYAILRLAQLASQNGRVLPEEIMLEYLEKELNADQTLIKNTARSLEKRKFIETIERRVLPVEVGYSRSNTTSLSQTPVRGYTITEDGKNELELYGIVKHHAFGLKLFPELDTGC